MIEKDNICKTYYENGQLKSEENVVDGKRNGIAKWYYENGQLEFEANYKDNEVVSIKRYDINGKLMN